MTEMTVIERGPSRVLVVDLHDDHDGDHVRVDRQTPYGNPFRLKKDGGDYTRKESVEQFKEWWYGDEQQELRARLKDEIGEKYGLESRSWSDEVRTVPSDETVILACWCAPQQCHAEVIAEWILRDFSPLTPKEAADRSPGSTYHGYDRDEVLSPWTFRNTVGGSQAGEDGGEASQQSRLTQFNDQR